MAQQTANQRAMARRRAAAAEAARRAQRRRRLWRAGGALVVAIVVVGVALYARRDDGKSKVDAGASTTTTAAGSAAGKPCVAVADPLPAGAPAVPVQVGPPPSALVVQDLKPGTGAEVVATSTLTVNYIGVSCSTGKIFDSSYKTGQPATFPLGQVIPGWQKGLTGMKVGGERLLGIPPDDAYGPQGRPPTIAPSETLWFVVDVVDAK